MTREEWLARAEAKLQPHGFTNVREYAESLYVTYVEDDGELWADDPEGAVDEDLSYYGD